MIHGERRSRAKTTTTLTKEYAMTQAANTTNSVLDQRLLKIVIGILSAMVSILITIGTWHINSQSSQIGSLTIAVNESVIQQRELFVKIENFERHLMKSDQSIQSLERRMNSLEIRVERIDEKVSAK